MWLNKVELAESKTGLAAAMGPSLKRCGLCGYCLWEFTAKHPVQGVVSLFVNRASSHRAGKMRTSRSCLHLTTSNQPKYTSRAQWLLLRCCFPHLRELHFQPTLTLSHTGKGVLGNVAPNVTKMTREQFNTLIKERWEQSPFFLRHTENGLL